MERSPHADPRLSVRDRAQFLWDRSSVRWAVFVLVAVVAIAGGLAWKSRPAEQASSPDVLRTGSPVAAVSAAASGPSGTPAPVAAGVVVVDVVGPVRRPGVVTLPAGSRVADAIAAAGGLKQGATPVNLARLVIDGEQIDVRGSPGPDTAGSLGSSSSGGGCGGSSSAGGRGTGACAGGSPGAVSAKVSLNQATIAQLEQLPRVGPVMAQKIIDFRTQHGGFRSVDQLKEVGGIGEVTFAGLAPLVVL